MNTFIERLGLGGEIGIVEELTDQKFILILWSTVFQSGMICPFVFSQFSDLCKGEAEGDYERPVLFAVTLAQLLQM